MKRYIKVKKFLPLIIILILIIYGIYSSTKKKLTEWNNHYLTKNIDYSLSSYFFLITRRKPVPHKNCPHQTKNITNQKNSFGKFQ